VNNDPGAKNIAVKFTIMNAINYNGQYDNPYGEAGASKKIADILLDVELEGILDKWST